MSMEQIAIAAAAVFVVVLFVTWSRKRTHYRYLFSCAVCHRANYASIRVGGAPEGVKVACANCLAPLELSRAVRAGSRSARADASTNPTGE